LSVAGFYAKKKARHFPEKSASPRDRGYVHRSRCGACQHNHWLFEPEIKKQFFLQVPRQSFQWAESRSGRAFRAPLQQPEKKILKTSSIFWRKVQIPVIFTPVFIGYGLKTGLVSFHSRPFFVFGTYSHFFTCPCKCEFLLLFLPWFFIGYWILKRGRIFIQPFFFFGQGHSSKTKQIAREPARFFLCEWLSPWFCPRPKKSPLSSSSSSCHTASDDEWAPGFSIILSNSPLSSHKPRHCGQ
jgi:hypothetical protein